MIKLEQIKMPIGFDKTDIANYCTKTLKINAKNIKNIIILKQSIDARKKPNVFYVVSVAVDVDKKTEKIYEHLKYEHDYSGLEYQSKTTTNRPVVVGFGPAGMFCALALAKMGLKPLVIEQGKCVQEREKDVQKFWKNGLLNKYSNVQFGEGGAGTFSDGKLNTNLNNQYCKKVIRELYNHGAPEEILYMAKPHIGSDNLKNVVTNIRKQITNLGGEVMFNTQLCDITVKNGEITHITTKNVQTQQQNKIACTQLVLAVGHSARSCFEMLYNKNITIHQKPFAMGVRIEHLQQDINIAQYGQNYDKRLPAADYKLAVHLPNQRSLFTFCMCPGGMVVASSSDKGEIVTNGMSNFARNEKNANSALLVNVMPSDYNSEHPLAGIYFQQKYEKLAYKLAGGGYKAPCQSVGDFIGEGSKQTLECSYRPNVTYCNISDCLPEFVTQTLKQGLPLLNQKLKNFAKPENLLIAIESRSSSPITIVRDENYQASIKGIYPCGEGAGYAGGIISAAQDGIKVAEKIYQLC